MEEGNPIPNHVTLGLDKGAWKQFLEVWEGRDGSEMREGKENDHINKGKGLKSNIFLGELETKAMQNCNADLGNAGLHILEPSLIFVEVLCQTLEIFPNVC